MGCCHVHHDERKGSKDGLVLVRRTPRQAQEQSGSLRRSDTTCAQSNVVTIGISLRLATAPRKKERDNSKRE